MLWLYHTIEYKYHGKLFQNKHFEFISYNFMRTGVKKKKKKNYKIGCNLRVQPYSIK